LGRGVQSSKYSMYVCGWPPRPALTLSLIEHFEITSFLYEVFANPAAFGLREPNPLFWAIRRHKSSP
jgi:hypothetical protein